MMMTVIQAALLELLFELVSVGPIALVRYESLHSTHPQVPPALRELVSVNPAVLFPEHVGPMPPHINLGEAQGTLHLSALQARAYPTCVRVCDMN